MANTRAEANAANSPANSVNCDLLNAVPAGDLIVAWADCNNGDPPTNPFSDNVNGTWGAALILVRGVTSSSSRLYLGYMLSSAPAAGGLTVACQGNSSSDRIFTHVTRYHSSTAGSWTKVDHQKGQDPGSTGTALDSGTTAASASAGDLLTGFGITGGSNGSAVFTAGNDGAANSYTKGIDFGWCADEYILNATSGTKKATFAISVSSGWGMAVAIWRNSAVVDSTAPTVPSNLGGVAIGPNRVDLSWTASTDNVGVTGYTVYRGGSSIGTTANTVYSDFTAVANTGYSYTVDAYDAAGNHSAQSSAVVVTTPAAPPATGWPRLARLTVPYA